MLPEQIESLFDKPPDRYTDQHLRLFQEFKDGLNGGSAGAGPVSGAAVVSGEEVVVAAVLLLCSLLVLTIAITTAAITATATIEPPAITRIRRVRACWARRSSCRSSLRLAVARRCSLVGTAGLPPWSVEGAEVACSG